MSTKIELANTLKQDRSHALNPKVIRPTPRLLEQIAAMVASSHDYVVDADGIDPRVHMVVNDFSDGVWLYLHHGECNVNRFTRLQRLA